MEMVELTQKEIRILLSLMETLDLETMELSTTISELVHLHSKLTSAQTY